MFKNKSSLILDESWFYNENLFRKNIYPAFNPGEFGTNVSEWKKLIAKYKYKLGPAMGEDSAFGMIYPFEPTVNTTKNLPSYVLKRVEISPTNPRLLMQSIREALFGETFVDASIPIVIAHRYVSKLNSYEILMQNIVTTTKAQKTVDSTSLRAYLWYQEVVKKNKKLHVDDMKLIHDTIVDFYQKTKYFHGDLHLNNIMVTFEKKNPDRLTRVYIIDFGSSMPFLKSDWDKINKMTRLHQFIPVMNKAYKKLSERENFLYVLPTRLGNKIEELVWLKHGGAVVHNLKQQQSRSFWDALLKFSRKRETKTVKRIKKIQA